jgi:hypothetical protein
MHIKKNQFFLFFSLMVLSCFAFSRAGFGHGGFGGARSFGHSYHGGRGSAFEGILILSYLGLSQFFYKIKSWFFSSNQSKKQVVEKSVDDEINQLHYQQIIDKDASELKHLFAKIYKKMQQGWSEQDLERHNKILSSLLISDLNKQLKSLKKANLIDYIDEIVFDNVNLISVMRYQQSVIIRTRLMGSMIDERISKYELGDAKGKHFVKKPFNDILEFSYDSVNGWKAVFLKTG